MVEGALAKNGALDANFILYSQSGQIVRTKLTDEKQISAMAYPRDKENVFLVTINNPDIPAAMRNNVRPGLTGRAKIELGHRPLLFNVVRRVYRWCRFKWIG